MLVRRACSIGSGWRVRQVRPPALPGAPSESRPVLIGPGTALGYSIAAHGLVRRAGHHEAGPQFPC